MSERTDLTGKQLAALANLRAELGQLREARADRDALYIRQFDVPERVHRVLSEEVERYSSRIQTAVDALDAALTAARRAS